MSYFTDYVLGVDGFGLTTTKNTNATHAFGMFRAGFRIGEHDNLFLQSGIAVTLRLISPKGTILVNGDALSDASVSPFLGFAIPIL